MLFALLSRWLKTSPPPTPSRPEAETEDEEPVRGCGWFDSSHELRCGLHVTEHLSPDPVANDLPLGDWLELHLSGWRTSSVA